MKVYKETIMAGRTILRSVKISSGDHRDKRAPKKNITPDAVRKNNDRLAVKNLTADLNANFKGGDMHITLTYAAVPTLRQAKRDREKFLRDLRKELRKQGIELKYIAVTEYQNKRPHHHIVVNTDDMALIDMLWEKGFIHSTPLDDTGNYYKLAEYLIKETTKTFREEGSLHKRRYTCSRNIVHPRAKRQEVSLKELEEDPTPISGYYIPKDCERRFEHPVTGMEHLEYIEVALEAPRKYKVWPKGTLISTREYYKPDYFEEQMELDELPFL